MNYLDKQFYIWGTGIKSKEISSYCSEQLKNLNFMGYIDNDSSKYGKEFCGKKICSPDFLLEDRDCYIIIISRFYDEIRKQIEKEYSFYADRILDTNFLIQYRIMSRYENVKDDEIQEIYKRLEKYPLETFNYSFVDNYSEDNYVVKFDLDKQLYYVMFSGKKMYFPRSFESEEKVKWYYNCICMEQDDMSPHKYLTREFDVKENSIVIDAGAAEGNFSLSVIDKIQKVYIFEPDLEWMEALRYTFEPYMDKVVFVNKGLSNYQSNDMTTIDTEIKEGYVDFIKMDIEGEEYYALQGARNVIENSEHMKCAVCTYHQEFAYPLIKEVMERMKFHTEHSVGYMYFPSDSDLMRTPILRRGLIRGEK